MKAYTDVEQSKQLTEILPIETSDHHYVRQTHDYIGNHVDSKWSYPKYGNVDSKYARYIVQNFSSYETMPCWSLAALIDLIQDDIRIEKHLFDQSDMFTYSIISDIFKIRTYEHDELIDAVVEMIYKMHEQKIL